MNYHRIAPRDIFNEANFAKCVGQLTLLIHDHMLDGIAFEHDIYGVHGLNFQLDENTGGLLLRNMFVVCGESVTICRPLNSREAWPLFIEDKDGEHVEIFTDKGELNREFVQWLIAQ